MASSKPKKKAQEIPKHTKIQKRPLTRDPLPAKYSADSKTVYVSHRTPFISAVKRVRKHLAVFDKQIAASDESSSAKNRYSRSKASALKTTTEDKSIRDDKKEVRIKATGRAIEKALGLALYFQGQNDVEVVLHTGTEVCTDDVVKEKKEVSLEELMGPGVSRKRKVVEEGGEGDDTEMTGVEKEKDDDEEEGDDEEVDDDYPTKTRNTSVLEVIIWRKRLGKAVTLD